MSAPLSETAAVSFREGIPYWIFWFLLSLIVLLLIFILLRDKELRRRLSLSLAGTKRRVLRKSLELRLLREKRKKAFLCREIGRTVWGEKILPDDFRPAFDRLGRIEEEIAARHALLQDLYDEIQKVKTGAGETRKRRRIRELERKSKAERRRLREKGREKSREYERLGARTDEMRIEHDSLADWYVRIDKVNRAILAVLDRIEKTG